MKNGKWAVAGILEFRGAAVSRNSAEFMSDHGIYFKSRKTSEKQWKSNVITDFFRVLYKDVILFCFSQSNFPKYFDKYLAHICHA